MSELVKKSDFSLEELNSDNIEIKRVGEYFGMHKKGTNVCHGIVR